MKNTKVAQQNTDKNTVTVPQKKELTPRQKKINEIWQETLNSTAKNIEDGVHKIKNFEGLSINSPNSDVEIDVSISGNKELKFYLETRCSDGNVFSFWTYKIQTNKYAGTSDILKSVEKALVNFDKNSTKHFLSDIGFKEEHISFFNEPKFDKKIIFFKSEEKWPMELFVKMSFKNGEHFWVSNELINNNKKRGCIHPVKGTSLYDYFKSINKITDFGYLKGEKNFQFGIYVSDFVKNIQQYLSYVEKNRKSETNQKQIEAEVETNKKPQSDSKTETISAKKTVKLNPESLYDFFKEKISDDKAQIYATIMGDKDLRNMLGVPHTLMKAETFMQYYKNGMEQEDLDKTKFGNLVDEKIKIYFPDTITPKI